MRVTATKLRANVYSILDEVLETGNPIEVERKGKILKIVPEKKESIWERIAKLPPFKVVDSKNLEVQWEWTEPANLDKLERIAATRNKRPSRRKTK